MLLRRTALQTLEPRAAAMGEALLQQQRLVAGSPQEIMTQLSEQIDNIQQQLQTTSRAIARRGGAMAGGQRQRAQSQVMAQAASQLQGLFGQGAAGGRQALLALASGIRPTTALQVPPATESITTAPFAHFGEMGQASVALAQQLQRLFQGQGQQPNQPILMPWAPSAAPVAPATAPLYNPATTPYIPETGVPYY
jgi:hypothetical protein